jgi:hypothetical protein
MANTQGKIKTSLAFDEQENEYSSELIDTPAFAAQFLIENPPPLHDLNYDSVRPIPTHTRDGKPVRAHFRLNGLASGSRIGIGERDNQTHEDVINDLLSQLNSAESNVVFTTTVFGNQNAHHEVWRCPATASYRWVREPKTRHWVDGKQYIQPDLFGYDESRRSPGPNNKSIVIEVIRTHEPDPATWDRLLELSTRNHLVLFFYCNQKGGGNWLGSTVSASPGTRQQLKVRTELYLLDGMLHKGKGIFKSDLSGNALRAAIFAELKKVKTL